MPFTAAIKKNLGMTAERRHHHVLPAIVIQVAKCRTAPCYRGSHAGIRPFKAPLVVHRKQRELEVVQRWIDGLNVIQNVSLCYKQILPSIIIEIFQADAPPRTPA